MSQQNTGGLSGMFRRSPKPTPKSDHGKDNLPVRPEQYGSDGILPSQSNSGMLGWIFHNPFSTAAQHEKEKAEKSSVSREMPSEKKSESMQGIFSDTVSKLNPFHSTPKLTQSKETESKSPCVPPRPSEAELSNTISYHTSSKPQWKDQEERAVGSLEEQKYEPKKSGEEEQDKSQDDSDGGVVGTGDPKGSSKETHDVEKNMDNKAMKKKVKKKKNPFMPHVTAKGRAVQKRTGGSCTDPVESDAQSKSLMEQLNELRLDRTRREEEEGEEEGVGDLMEWWSTVKQWEQISKDEDMTEKEEARAFALTAEKVQRGIRVFNQLFSERAEGLWQHVIDLRAIADSLDRFSWRAKVAQITGGSTSAVGGIATIAGLALAPVSMGTSLIVTAVGLSVATAGGLTSASAGISSAVNNSMDRKKVERIVEDYQSKMADLNKCMKFIKQGIENLRKFNLLKVKKQAYNRDFPGLGSIYEDGAMASKAVLINANEIMRVVQIANVAGSTAARAVQIASMATGVLTGLFVGMDIYFVAKDSQELKKGAKSEFAAKIREVADQLHEGLVELNSIREELQSSKTPSGNSSSKTLSSYQEENQSSGPIDGTFLMTATSSKPEEQQQSLEILDGTPSSATSSSNQEENQHSGPSSDISIVTTTTSHFSTSSNQEELHNYGPSCDTFIISTTASNKEEHQSSGTPSGTSISTISFSRQSSDPVCDTFLMTTTSSTQEGHHRLLTPGCTTATTFSAKEDCQS